MAIERKVDDLGRVVLPKEMRDSLGIESNDKVSIEREGNKIIVKNYKETKTITEIKEELESMKQSSTEYCEGYKDALRWVLNVK